MLDIDKILTGKIAHMMRSGASTKKDETYCCSLCSYCDVADCEAALEKDILELQKLIDAPARTELERLKYENSKAEQCLRTAEELQRLQEHLPNFRGWETSME